MYRHLPHALIRTTVLPASDPTPAYPGPEADPSQMLAWLTAAWQNETLRQGVRNASPDLADAVTALLTSGTDPDRRTLRRVALSLARYHLRATTRATPFGLLAGVGPARLAETSIVAHTEPKIRTRPDALWLEDRLATEAADPKVVEQSVVVADETIRRHGDELVLPHRPYRDGPTEARLRATTALTTILDLARTPVAVPVLADRVAEQYPDVPRDVVLVAMTGLVRERFLHSDVRSPTTVFDPLSHLATHRAPQAGAIVAAGPGPAGMTDLITGTQVTLAASVGRELERALAVMARISPHPHGTPAWGEYRSRFLDTYSLGTFVPVTELVDPVAGIGYPAGYRGSPPQAVTAVTGRDEHLLARVQRVTADRSREVILTDHDIEALSVAPPASVPSSAAMNVSVHALSCAAIDAGEFRVVCGGLSVSSGITLGRFLPLLDPVEQAHRVAGLASLPTLDADAIRVQVSSPALRTRTQNVARSTQVVPDLIAVGEHNPAATIRLADLAIGATTSRLFLVHLPTGRRVEPFVLNALEPASATHPMVRFLCELPRAHTAVMAPFSWGAASGLPFLPAVRTGRVVLSEALWRAQRTDVERPGVSGRYALDVWLDRWEVPDDVFLGAYDRRLRLDLTEPGHRDLLLHEIRRLGRVTLTQAPSIEDLGWIGHAHQLTVEFAATQKPAITPEPFAGAVLARRDHVRHPGSSRTCLLKVYAPADLTTAILDGDLRSVLVRDAGIDDWWFTRYTDPAEHLRLRLRLYSTDDFGTVAQHLAAWAARARRDGLVSRIRWDDDAPELGRYGTGTVLDAAEAVFVADSRAALAQMTIAPPADQQDIELDTWRAALVVASMTDLATAFLGEDEGHGWLVEHLRRDAAAHPGREMQTLAGKLAGPDGRTILDQTQHGPRLLAAWAHRHDALRRYAARLRSNGTDPANILGALLHMHHNRALGIKPEREAAILRATRNLALSATARAALAARREAVLA